MLLRVRGGLGDGASSGAPSIGAPAGGWQPVGRFDAEQVGFAAIIVSVGAQTGMPIRGWIIAVATALQESDLRNPAGGDQESIGLVPATAQPGLGHTRADPRSGVRPPQVLREAPHNPQLAINAAHRSGVGGAVQRLPQRVRQARTRRHPPHVYPGEYVTCVHNPDRALCHRPGQSNEPSLPDCQPTRCRNVALSGGNREALARHRSELHTSLQAAGHLAPYLRHRLQQRYEEIDGFLTTHAHTEDRTER